ncbi:MAG: hypothetical protein JXA87_08675 [Thermoleophilia bacterium]|nr:hypothetical protein [Thermoleophilia bacterium]
MSKNRRRTSIVVVLGLMVLALVALAVAGCGDETTTTTAAPATTAAPPETTEAASGGGGIAVTGMVDNPATLTVADLEGLGVETFTVEHPKKGQVEYSGVAFAKVLDLLKVQSGAATLAITASDGFSAEVALADIAGSATALLAIDEGAVSSVFAGLETSTWVKDIISMEFK